jgi:aspartyl/asparaginyl beta-hydroxylase (cupin superfamily)
MAVRRCHIPLITNDDIKFTVGDHTMSLKQGECWEINNSKIHEVKNLSNYDRVHILIDIIPNEYLNGDPYNV